MSTLQIRQMPESLYAMLCQRAALAHRSLTQQTIVDLTQAMGGEVKSKRMAALQKIRMAQANTANAQKPNAQKHNAPKPNAHKPNAQMPNQQTISPQALATWLREDRER